MKNKKIISLIILAFSFFLLTACSGPKLLQGTWNTNSALGEKGKFTFKGNKMKWDEKKAVYFDQKASGTENGVKYYAFKLKDTTYSIIFPTDDNKIALLIRPTKKGSYIKGTLLFAMNKDEQPDYFEYRNKYLE